MYLLGVDVELTIRNDCFKKRTEWLVYMPALEDGEHSKHI